MRATVHQTTTAEDAITYIANAKRGCPFLVGCVTAVVIVVVVSWAFGVTSRVSRGCRAASQYPVSDASGNSAVVECAAYNASSDIPDPRQLVQNTTLLAALPSFDFLQKYSTPEYRNGAYVRRVGYETPQQFLDFNPGALRSCACTG